MYWRYQNLKVCVICASNILEALQIRFESFLIDFII